MANRNKKSSAVVIAWIVIIVIVAGLYLLYRSSSNNQSSYSSNSSQNTNASSQSSSCFDNMCFTGTANSSGVKLVNNGDIYWQYCTLTIYGGGTGNYGASYTFNQGLQPNYYLTIPYSDFNPEFTWNGVVPDDSLLSCANQGKSAFTSINFTYTGN
jgi:hypothetical protein